MKKYYYINYGSPMFAKLHIYNEKLETLPRGWREVTEEEFKKCCKSLGRAFEEFEAYTA